MNNKEGGLGAPIRNKVDWTNKDFTDESLIDDELRRVFDICHGCRRCFNLCESFPKLFDLIDESKTGELDSVESKDFKEVVDACTLCDMCFLTKCPYVPPHEFNLDFPHLMLRYRAMERKNGVNKKIDDQLTETDRNGKIFSKFSKLANWSTSTKNKFTRPVMETLLKIDKEAELPKYYSKTFIDNSKLEKSNQNSNQIIDKVAIFPSCFVNYNNPNIGTLTEKLFKKLNIETKTIYEGCCGMPQLEGGDLKSVVEKAKKMSKAAKPLIESGYKIISIVPSCSLMLKYEWPLLSNDEKDIKLLSESTLDICEYLVDLYKTGKVKETPRLPNEQNVTVHISCHSRAQNIGQKSAELLKIISNLNVDVIERCSGHGGSWGIKKGNFKMAIKVGKPVARKTIQYQNEYLVSECPLAGVHIQQGVKKLDEKFNLTTFGHPIELFALANSIK